MRRIAMIAIGLAIGVALVILLPRLRSSSPLERDAKAMFQAGTASCSKAGLMLFVGEQTTVYSCRLEDVDGAHRPLADADQDSFVHCFVRAKGQTFDVTEQINALQKISPDETFNCR